MKHATYYPFAPPFAATKPSLWVSVTIAFGIPGTFRHFAAIGNHQGQGARGVHAQIVHGLAAS